MIKFQILCAHWGNAGVRKNRIKERKKSYYGVLWKWQMWNARMEVDQDTGENQRVNFLEPFEQWTWEDEWKQQPVATCWQGVGLDRLVEDPFGSLLKIAQKLVWDHSSTTLKILLKRKAEMESYGTFGGKKRKYTQKTPPKKRHHKKDTRNGMENTRNEQMAS